MGGLKVIIGLILIVAGLYWYLSGWLNDFFARQFIELAKLALGNVPGMVVFVGLMILLLGISEARS